MRITSLQQEAIRKITAELAGDDAILILFGSRIDDDKRGGDLDLLVELLISAMQTAQNFVSSLTEVGKRLQAELQQRGWD
jgi:predicted nucleotidyltransferase